MVGIAAIAVALAISRDPYGRVLLLFTFVVACGVGLGLLGDFTDRWLRSRHAAWADLVWILLVPVAFVALLLVLASVLGLFLLMTTWSASGA
jgi:hypothetical protein